MASQTKDESLELPEDFTNTRVTTMGGCAPLLGTLRIFGAQPYPEGLADLGNIISLPKLPMHFYQFIKKF